MTPRDPGLQPERTALAWQRTALAAAVAAVLLLRSGMLRGEPLEAVAGALLVVVPVVAVTRRRRAVGSPRWMLALTTGAVVLAGLLITVQLLSHPA